MKSAIITGASGFIGTHLTGALLAGGTAVTALCRKGSPNAARLPGEVRIVHTIDELPEADVFYHLAWEQASGPGRGDAVLQSRNAELALRALTAASERNAKFVALGTVYERLFDTVTQAGKFSGADFYILSKRFAREMCNQLAYKLGCGFVWCRICHPIGRYIKREQLMAYAICGLLSGTSPAFGPAETLYDITAVEDVARGLVLLGKHETSRREYFIGSGEPRPLKDYLESARRVLHASTPLLIGARPDDGLRFEREWFDTAPLSTDTGYTAGVTFDRAVQNVAAWLQEK